MKNDEMTCPYCGNPTEGIVYPEICDEKLEHGLEELAIRFELGREDLINDYNTRLKRELFEKQYGERLKSFKEENDAWSISVGLFIGFWFAVGVLYHIFGRPLSAEYPLVLFPILFCILWGLSTALVARCFMRVAIDREERKLLKDFK